MAKKCEHDRVIQTCSVCRPEQVYAAYRYKAKQRNLSFSLTLEEFEALVNAPCHYCGDLAMGIDRLDNRIGYINAAVRNCVPACQECNFAKRVMLPESFVRMCVRVAEHQKKIAEQKKKAKLEQKAAAEGKGDVVNLRLSRDFVRSLLVCRPNEESREARSAASSQLGRDYVRKGSSESEA
jgi:hypothetical protein